MPGRLENISVPRMLELCHEAEPEELAILVDVAKRSDPLLAGFSGGTLLCVLGFVPKTIISDEAYIWMCTTPEVREHKVLFGRWAKRLITSAHERYPRLVGHCSKDSVGWLRHLGARFGAVGELVEFEIVRGDV